MTQTEQLVTKFLNLLQQEKPLLEDAIKMLTVTQQHEHKYIGGVDVKTALNLLHNVMIHTKEFTVSDIENEHEMVKDVIIKLHSKDGNETKSIMCRCVKESGVRQPRIDGEWGINMGSFKFVG